MSAPIMLKALASFLNVTPEEITANFEQLRGTALNGVELLERIDARLSAIEQKLGIESVVETAPQLERQTDGQEN
jgi:signal transduction histidine kinase